jgi:hypothetical protein
MPANAHNLYTPDDGRPVPDAERVFLSHRQADRELAACVADMLEALGVHYWLDRDDEDTQRAAALGLLGEQALVHAIDRGVRHSTRILGLLSARTVGSWWVPYEIAAGRCSEREVSFLVLESIRSMDSLPEYVRLAANYWSVDELVHWAAGIRSRPEAAVDVASARLTALERYVPREPPTPTVRAICREALDAIERLQAPEVWTALELTDREQFDWLPTNGGIIRDIAYALLAPLALFQRGAPSAHPRQRNLLRELYRSPTEHYEIGGSEGDRR